MKSTKARGQLMAIGGGEDKQGDNVILKEFVRRAGGDKAEIVVMTTATEFPEEVGAEYIQVFKHLGVKKVAAIDVSDRADAMKQDSIEAVEKASGLFFTGGNQLHITSLMGGTELLEAVQRRYEKDLIIAGTSAGAAMMGNSMIISGDSNENPRSGCVEIAPGTDLIIGCLIDTHFSQRGRHGRLLTAIAHYPQDIGFGIDENTAMIVEKGGFTVLGEGAVTVIDGGSMSYTDVPYVEKGSSLSLAGVKIHVLSENYKFDFKTRQMIIPKRTKAKTAGMNENGKTPKK